jgi:predicted outer membrane protein/sporulation protein YlmC with PRC-barrel domain
MRRPKFSIPALSTAPIAGLLALGLAAPGLAPVAAAQGAPAAASPAQEAPAASAVDREFAQQALRLGLGELALGSLAQQRAADPTVRRFGARMVDDHGSANAELLSLARTAGLGELSAQPDAAHQAEIRRLTALSGQAFDHAFMDRMVADHRQAIARFEAYAKAGHSVALKAFALRTLETLRAHLQSAEATHVAANHVRPARIDPQQPVTQGLDRRATRLIGMEVLGAYGEPLGKLEDLVLDVRDGSVHYAVLSFGGLVGLGDRLFAFPLQQFRLTASEEGLLLPGVSADRLQQAPGFERGRWPDWNDHALQSEVDKFHGAAPTRPGRHLVRASELAESDVHDATGREVGEVEDAVVNLASARVRYLVIEHDPGWFAAERLLPLPLAAVHFPADPRADLLLAVEPERVARQAGFDGDHWPDLNDTAERRRIDAALDELSPGAGR